jgi:hypothetical protein
VEGGEQRLDALLMAHREELLAGLEDTEPPGPPDPERWPHRAHEIPERTWKRWLQAINDVLSYECYSLMDHGLVPYVVLDSTNPRLALCAADEDEEGDEPEVVTEGTQTLARALLERLQIPPEALGPAAQLFAGKLDRVGRRLYNVRAATPGRGPSLEERLTERRAALIETLQDSYVPDVPDPDLWPHRAREISDEIWWDWVESIDDTLDEFNGELQEIDLALVLTFDLRRGPELTVRTLEDEPLQSPIARAFASDALVAMRIPRPALEMLLATRAEGLEKACRRLSNVVFED